MLIFNKWAIASLVVGLLGVMLADAVTPTIRYDCNPCLERSKYKVEMIVHGSNKDPFWQQVTAGATQAAKDMNIQLDMKLYDKFDISQMIDDIKKVPGAGGDDEPDVLIVSLPSDDVAEVAKDVVIDAGIPVIGINSGSTKGKDIGVLDFVAPNDIDGGMVAGQTIIDMATSNSIALSNVLFVNDEKGNVATSERYIGLQSAFEADTTTTVTVEEYVIDGSMDTNSMTSSMSSKLSGCPYQAVMLSGTRTVESTSAALANAGCSTTTTLLGSFDTSEAVFDAIGSSQLSFTIDNQQYLQGSLTTVLASLVATTGMSLAPSAEVDGGAYITGPKVITKETLPSDTRKQCINDAFPVCPMNKVSCMVFAPMSGESLGTTVCRTRLSLTNLSLSLAALHTKGT